jgi:phage regulator Rha-like protein
MAGEQTSGIIKAETLNGKKGFLVTPHFVDRYNALIEQYAERFFPPLLRNAGITP